VTEAEENQVVIYTDGACRGNPGPGGWGALLCAGGKERELCGGERHTTSNRMELSAAIEALRALEQPREVQLYTDSQYLRQGMTAWIQGWKRNGWKTASRQPVKNQALWQALDELCEGHRVSWHWVKGHAGIAGNERADMLANRGLEKALVRDLPSPETSTD